MRTDIVIRMQAKSEKGQHSKAMQIATAIDGVESVTLSGEGRNLLRVVGEDLDSNDLITKLRKKMGRVDIVELRTLQAGRGYATTSATGGGGYHSAQAGPLGCSAAYGQYPAARHSPPPADKYYSYQQPSYEYYPPPPHPAKVVLHGYPTGDSTGCCSIMQAISSAIRRGSFGFRLLLSCLRASYIFLQLPVGCIISCMRDIV